MINLLLDPDALTNLHEGDHVLVGLHEMVVHYVYGQPLVYLTTAATDGTSYDVRQWGAYPWLHLRVIPSLKCTLTVKDMIDTLRSRTFEIS